MDPCLASLTCIALVGFHAFFSLPVTKLWFSSFSCPTQTRFRFGLWLWSQALLDGAVIMHKGSFSFFLSFFCCLILLTTSEKSFKIWSLHVSLLKDKFHTVQSLSYKSNKTELYYGRDSKILFTYIKEKF